MCVPSARVCVNWVVTCAEYGAPVTTLPKPNSPRMNPKSPGPEGPILRGQPGPRRMGPSGPGDFGFMRGEFGFGKVVTGAPYSAQVTTQFTQTLADGTHIQRSATASVARDSQGRSRREGSMAAGMALFQSGPNTRSVPLQRTAIFIHDPVASMSYV